MTCDRYRPLLALLAGNDLGSREGAEVRQHLSDCAACQAHWESLQTSMTALHMVSQQTVVPVSESIWYKLSRRLGSRPMLPREDAPGWLTLGAFSAACVAVLWLTVSTPVFDFDFREVQVADLPSVQQAPANPFASQYPSMQLVNDAQSMIPVEIVAEGDDGSNQRLVSPRSPGGPRSF